MRVIITGGTGYIGSHALIEILKQDNFEILVLDNLSNSKIGVIDKISNFTKKKIDFIEVDLRDYDSIETIFMNFKPEAVVHFAGLKSVNESFNKVVEYYDNNIISTINLLKVMNLYECKSIIFSSSATVYGNPKYLPIDENHPLNPVNPYGNTKLIAENIISDWVKSKKNNSSIILRCFNPVGADKSSCIGEDPTTNSNNLFPSITKVIEGSKNAIKIFGNDYDTKDGTAERDFIHVSDVARAHILALEMTLKQPTNEIINIGSGKSISVIKVIEEFEKIIGKSIKKEIHPRREGDSSISYSCIKKSKKLLNFETKLNNEFSCRSFLNWKKIIHDPSIFK